MWKTDLSHESIRGNLDQKISILYKCHLESTMFRIRHAWIHEQRCGSSMGLEVKATSGRPVVHSHLQMPNPTQCPRSSTGTLHIDDNPRCALFIFPTISCIDSITQTSYLPFIAGQHKTYLGHPRYWLPIHFLLSLDDEHSATSEEQGR